MRCFCAPFRSTFSLLLLALLLTNAGCGSVINPHVRATGLDPREDPQKKVDLDNAIQYAEKVKAKYMSAVGDQSKLNTWLGLTLIPLGAVGAFIGITSSSAGSMDALLGLSLAGAAGYGMGNYLRSRPRSLVYISGARAIGCAIGAIRPYQLSKEQKKEFKRALHGEGSEVSLARAVGNISVLIGNVQVSLADLKSKTPDNPLVRVVEDYLPEVRTFEAAARRALGEAHKLDQGLSSAGYELLTAVDSIMARVDEAVEATLPNLGAIDAVLSGLVDSSKKFGEISAGAAPSPPSEPAAPALQAAAEVDTLKKDLAELRGAVGVVVSKTATLDSIGGAVREGLAVGALSDCGVDIEAPSLELIPGDAVTVVSGTVSERRLVVVGGQPLYFAQLLDKVDGLAVASISEASAAYVVITTAEGNEIPPGTYRGFVYDSTGPERGKSFDIHVKQGEPEDGGGGNADETSAVELSEAEMARARAALCLGDDVEDLTEALRVFQATRSFEVTGELTQEQKDSLLDPQQSPDCQPGRRNYYENSLSPQSIQQIQETLEVDQTGQLDEATRQAIMNFQTGLGLENADGALTPELVQQIINPSQ